MKPLNYRTFLCFSGCLIILSLSCTTGQSGADLSSISAQSSYSSQAASQSSSSVRAISNITITSQSFTNGGDIIEKYCFNLNGHWGSNISPELTWTSIPPGTASFVLLMEDPYAPGYFWSHWILYNIPSSNTNLAEGYAGNSTMGIPGHIDSGAFGYEGPYPPLGEGLHTYYFRIYAIDKVLTISANNATRSGIIAAMDGSILGYGELTGKHPGH